MKTRKQRKTFNEFSTLIELQNFADLQVKKDPTDENKKRLQEINKKLQDRGQLL